MTATSMSNVVQTLQTTIFNILNSDTTSLSITDTDGTALTITLSGLNIVDGIPTNLMRGTGFPYIIVHTPEVDESRLTMTKHKIELTVHIEILDRREGNVRIFTDAVKDALHNNQDTTRASGYMWYGRRVRSNINYTFLPGSEEKAVWHNNIFFTYLWTGS